MQHTQEVDVIFAVLGSQEILVYGEDLLRHCVADGETVQAQVVKMPIGRPESAEVWEAY